MSTAQAAHAAVCLMPGAGTAHDQVYLADNEWGSHLMAQVAAEWFTANPGTAFVCVHEHAGWSLTFAREGVECVASANGSARTARGRATGPDSANAGPSAAPTSHGRW